MFVHNATHLRRMCQTYQHIIRTTTAQLYVCTVVFGAVEDFGAFEESEKVLFSFPSEPVRPEPELLMKRLAEEIEATSWPPFFIGNLYFQIAQL